MCHNVVEEMGQREEREREREREGCSYAEWSGDRELEKEGEINLQGVFYQYDILIFEDNLCSISYLLTNASII